MGLWVMQLVMLQFYYQTQKGIAPNGWVGPQTWGKIDDDTSYDSTVYFSSDGYFDIYGANVACFEF